MAVVDPQFADTLKKFGAKNVTVCFNCGNCTAICPLSTNEHMFPRKIIRYIQLGLKDKALKAPEPWICHACGECSVTCPRQAFPSEIMNAVRTYAFTEYASPKFVGKLFKSPAFIPILVAIPAIIFAIFAKVAGIAIPKGSVVFENFIPIRDIEYAGLILGLYVGITALASAWKFWKDLELKSKGFVSDLIKGVILILKHSRFRECETNRFRYYAHALVFYGFLLLGLAALGDVVYFDIMGYSEASLTLTNPIKIIGNVGAILLLVGIFWIVGKRLAERERVGAPNYNDWFFMGDLLIVAVTGVLMETAKLAGAAIAAYSLYVVHLIAVFCLLIYAPYSKFAHLIYRGLVYVYLEAEKTEQQQE